MAIHTAEKFIKTLFSRAGITVNGNEPWDIQVHQPALYKRIITQGSLGLGEAYMDGWWDAERLDTFFHRLLSAKLDEDIRLRLNLAWVYVRSVLFNMQSRRRSQKVARQHYDLDNELYMSFLDPYNQYTCGYFKDTADLNRAQEQKLELICRKLQLKSTDKVLDIGCGWGGFAKYAATHYHCEVTGITISDEQLKYAREYCKGLPVRLIKKDYRDLEDRYDKILICGMIEHVGYKNYRQIMEVVHRCLKDDGLFLLHTIGSNKSVKFADRWITKYIFPNSMLPSMKQLSTASEGLFIMEDWHNFGSYYEPTLLAWFKNFQEHWEQLKTRFDERFYRMWKYYLLASAGAFRAREMQLWQIVFSKRGVPGGYLAPR